MPGRQEKQAGDSVNISRASNEELPASASAAD